MNIAEQITKSRKSSQMTQEELAYQLGVTPQAVSKWERGLGVPDLGVLGELCKILCLDANQLLEVRAGDTCKRQIAYPIPEPLFLEVGRDWIPVVEEGLQTDFVSDMRKKLAQETGFLMPPVHIRDSMELAEGEYQISVYGRCLQKGALAKGSLTKEQRMEEYQRIIREVTEECEKNYAKILNKSIVKDITDSIKEQFPGVAENLIPEKISYIRFMDEIKKAISDPKYQRGDLKCMVKFIEELERQKVSADESRTKKS